uniref:uL23m n=2 Tax=Trypanosoma brucei TaxID=5691 RepID=UPI00178D07E8|nr:Chain AX, uL23m [Trypanosoma brucei brucei]6YXY_AX Chain AX, uL23m [Trypanosoma brucei brucei]
MVVSLRRFHSYANSSRGGATTCLITGGGKGHFALTVSTRGRFYRPLVDDGINLWRRRMGRIHKGWRTWEYQHTRPDPRPFPDPPVNDYFGRSRIWNPIACKLGYVRKKADEWGWPNKPPPPTGLRYSQEFFPFFFERYFPDAEVRLLLDSVLNNETKRPVFQIPCSMSKVELVNYLKNIYGIDNVVRVEVRNRRGRRYKNEVGEIKMMDDYKVAVVELDTPVSVELKQIKGTEDTSDNRPQERITQ